MSENLLFLQVVRNDGTVYRPVMLKYLAGSQSDMNGISDDLKIVPLAVVEVLTKGGIFSGVDIDICIIGDPAGHAPRMMFRMSDNHAGNACHRHAPHVKLGTIQFYFIGNLNFITPWFPHLRTAK